MFLLLQTSIAVRFFMTLRMNLNETDLRGSPVWRTSYRWSRSGVVLGASGASIGASGWDSVSVAIN